MDLNINNREFKDAVDRRYNLQISDVPNVCLWEPFNVDHAKICKRGGGGGASLYNVITSCGILGRICLIWSVMMLKLNLIISDSLARGEGGGGRLIQPSMPNLTFMQGVLV